MKHIFHSWFYHYVLHSFFDLFILTKKMQSERWKLLWFCHFRRCYNFDFLVARTAHLFLFFFFFLVHDSYYPAAILSKEEKKNNINNKILNKTNWQKTFLQILMYWLVKIYINIFFIENIYKKLFSLTCFVHVGLRKIKTIFHLLVLSNLIPLCHFLLNFP